MRDDGSTSPTLTDGAHGASTSMDRSLRESLERFELVARATNDALWDWNIDTGETWWGEGYKTLFGIFPESNVSGFDGWASRIHPDDVDRVRAGILGVIASGGQFWSDEYAFQRGDGSYARVLDRGYVQRDESGRPRRMVGALQDITARRRFEEALQRSERYLSSLIATVDGIVWEADAKTFRFTFVSAQAERLLGYPVSQWTADPKFWVNHLHPDDRDWAVEQCLQATRERRGHRFEYRMVAANGQPVWLRDIVTAVEADGELKLRGIMVDVTGEKRAAAALQERDVERRASEERITRQRAALVELTSRHQLDASHLRTALGRIAETAARTLNVARVSIWRYIADHSAIECLTLYESASGEQSSGTVLAAAAYPRYFQALEISEVIAAADAFTDPRTSEFADAYLGPLGIGAMLDAPIAAGGVHIGVLCNEHVGSARTWTADEKTFAVAVANLVSLALESSHRHDAELERRRLEEQFRHAQKMEAIGQLAGGVAHDFNNILSIIIMQAEEAESHDDVPPAARDGLQQIRSAAGRAADLTRQLLLFSRRQVMQSRDLDVNESVRGVAKMLRRIIGEDVRLELKLHAQPLMTHADPVMLDQALLNLAVNARDAMPRGGELLIETAPVDVDEATARTRMDTAPGHYVVLKVRDTGTGIPDAVLPHIFEPFYTTKDPGKGTGLGLATVFGIVKQHRGWIDVESIEDTGTTFSVFLPALAAPAASALPAPAPTQPRGGAETILLVEDDNLVRLLMRTALARHGYKVIEAGDAREALQRWQEHHAAIALLVTDLVMPGGMTGFELSRRLREQAPGLKVVFTSGYSAEIAGKEIDLLGVDHFLQKPFKRDDFLDAVRRAIDSQT